MDLILQEVKKSLFELVNTSSFQNLSESEKNDFVNRNFEIFKTEYPNFLASKIPASIIEDPIKLKEFTDNLDYEQATKEFIELFKTKIK